jgi:translation initiation factor IF-3
LVSETGEQLGIMETFRAIGIANERVLDLVEIAPDAVPPVCRLLNYGKFKYSLRKKEKEASKKQRVIKVKEVKIRPKIDEHDFQTKLRGAWKFLDHGDKVKVTLQFRGREISHKELGEALMKRVIEDLSEIGDVEQSPRDEGPCIIAILAPKPQRFGVKEQPKEKEEEDA